MGMFLNYQSISDNYTPNNTMCSFPVGKSYTKLDPVIGSKPYEEYDSKGELIGYSWRQGETLNLEFHIDGEIVVEDDALILTHSGEIPSNSLGSLYQRAYNIVDKLSWTCTSIIDTKATWTRDELFSYPTSGKSVYVTAEDYLKDKHVNVTLYNFRMEPICTQIFDGNSVIVFEITKSLSETLLRGIYYCSLTVFDDNVNLPIFTNKDCTLLVK